MRGNPPYYAVRGGRGFFELGRVRAERVGMSSSYALGPDGPRARASAWSLYAEWREAQGRPLAKTKGKESAYPPGSLGSWYAAYRQSTAWGRKAPTTRAEWEALWKHISPVLGHRPLREIGPAEFEAFQIALEERHGAVLRWRAVKIARALFNAAVKYRVLGSSPAMTLANPIPAGRSQIWFADEIDRKSVV